MIDDCIVTICLGCRSLSEISLPDVQTELSADIALQLLEVDATPGDQGLEYREQTIQNVQTSDYTIHIVYKNGLRRLIHALGSYIYTLPHRFTDTVDLMNNLLARRAKRRFVVLILLAYRGWVGKSGSSLQLKSVENNVVLLLDYLGYRHDNRFETEWHFLLDFDCEYTDPTGFTMFLPRVHPTKKSILETLEKVRRIRGSGLVYFGGNVYCGPPGTFVMSPYSVTEPQNLSEPRSPAFITADGNLISGKELAFSLRDKSKKVKASTITLVLDTCHAEGFLGDLPVTYAAHEVTQAPEAPPGRKRPHSQLVAVAATRIGERAGTIVDRGLASEKGALTLLLTQYLQRYPSSSATTVVKHLYDVCHTRQRPLIRSLYPLKGPLALLP